MIPFLDLKAINARYKDDIKARIDKVLDSGWYLLGEQNKKFEENFAAYCGARYCIGCANGLDALKGLLSRLMALA